MITDADIKKLKAVFATKDDLVAMEKRFDGKFATKEDLNRFATKDDLASMEKRFDAKFATKDDLKELHKAIIKDIADMISHKLLPILNEHEKRLDRLEKHAGGFPSFA